MNTLSNKKFLIIFWIFLVFYNHFFLERKGGGYIYGVLSIFMVYIYGVLSTFMVYLLLILSGCDIG